MGYSFRGTSKGLFGTILCLLLHWQLLHLTSSSSLKLSPGTTAGTGAVGEGLDGYGSGLTLGLGVVGLGIGKGVRSSAEIFEIER